MWGIEIDREHKELILDYEPRSDRSFYDICTEYGKVLQTGRIDKSSTRLNLSDLSNGIYSIHVIDGDEIKRRWFNID